MKVWIQNKVGYLQGYSIIPQETMTEVEADREPTDFTNWRYDGEKIIHDPENAPKPEVVPSELEKLQEENKVLKQELEETKADVTNTQIGLAEVYGIVMGGTE